jgi:hypothetical protein
LDSSKPIDQYLVEAGALHAQGSLREARELLEQAREVDEARADVHFNLGLCLGGEGDAAGAAASFQEAVRRRPEWADAHVYLVAYTLQAGDVARALELLGEAFKVAPDNASLNEQYAIATERSLLMQRERGRAADVQQPMGYLEGALAYLKSIDGAAAAPGDPQGIQRYIETLSRARGALDLAEASLAREHGLAFNRAIPPGTQRRFPGFIILSTMPKSGSEYVWSALTTGLNLKPARISSADVLGVIDKERLEQVSQGGFISHGHMHCTPENSVLLSTYADRVVVHVRDPRQALISWVHYQDHQDITSLPSGKRWGKTTEWRLKAQMDHFIDRFYADQLKFLRSWMDAERDDAFTPRILFARQEDLREDPDGYFRRILDFFEIEPELFRFPEPPKKGERHYRRGDTDEWRTVLQPVDIARMQEMLPDDMLDKFGWQR